MIGESPVAGSRLSEPKPKSRDRRPETGDPSQKTPIAPGGATDRTSVGALVLACRKLLGDQQADGNDHEKQQDLLHHSELLLSDSYCIEIGEGTKELRGIPTG